MNKFLPVLTFALGAGAGVLATREYFRKKYADLADEEIDSVKKTFNNDIFEDEDDLEPEVEGIDDEEYVEPIKKPSQDEIMARSEKARKKKQNTDYTSYAAVKKPTIEDRPAFDEPYAIAPARLGEYEDFKIISYTYYSADDVLANSMDEPVEDIAGTVGNDFLDQMGRWEPDCVYIRNEKLKIDYEILYDYGSHEDAVANRPHPVEIEEDEEE